MMMSAEHGWICVVCREPLALRGELAACPRCGAEYPQVGRVGVFVPPAHAFLSATRQQLATDAAALQASPGAPPLLAERARHVLAARTANQRLLEQVCAPVLGYLDGREPPETLTESIAEQRGWSREGMEYFFVDWARTASFTEVSELFTDAVTRHATTRGKAVALGSAAGGLVRELAPLFERVYGVDLAMPMLLMSRSLMDGASLKLSLPNASWQEVALGGAALAAPNVELLAADAVCLPFPDDSLSLATTQYFIDIVSDPLSTVRELHRVLAEGGLWVSYGLPLRLPGDPSFLGARTPAELRDFVESCGFQVLELERRRHTFMDLTAIAPGSRTMTESVDFFVARKVLTPAPALEPWARYHRGEPEAFWNCKARLFTGRTVQLMAGTTYSGGEARQTAEFGLSMDVREERSLYRVELPPETGLFLGALFELLQEPRSLRELQAALEAASGGLLTEADFVGAIRGLANLALLELDSGN